MHHAFEICFISNHTFWLHKTRQDTFYCTSFMDFISFHDLHVSISIYLFYCHLYDQFQFIHTFICLLYASISFILCIINFNLSIHLYVLFKSFILSHIHDHALLFQPRIYIFYICFILFKICLAQLI